MADTEKITINLGVVDLGKIDLLVEQGFYTNRTDFIRNAIRSNLDKHETTVQETITRKNSVLGILVYSASDLEKRQAKGEKMEYPHHRNAGIRQRHHPGTGPGDN